MVLAACLPVTHTKTDLEYKYYRWLIDKLGTAALDYSLLLKELYFTTFRWDPSIPDDSNREADGLALREMFKEEEYIRPDAVIDEPCSVLEALIALSERCEFDVMALPGEEDPYRWMWIALNNLDLLRCDDENFDKFYVDQQVKKWLERRYKSNGKGGAFPLKKPHGDQKKVPIWYQLMSFLDENYL